MTRMIEAIRSTTENDPTLEGEELERARRIDDRVVDYTRRIVEGAMRHLENRIQAMVQEMEASQNPENSSLDQINEKMEEDEENETDENAQPLMK
ncbi:unnamed protein product [Caenorhabditis nigoni]